MKTSGSWTVHAGLAGRSGAGALALRLALLIAAVPAAGAAQDARLAARLDPATRTAVEATIDTARSRGLPVEPLAAKALEGASKRAEGARIVAAVRALAGELATARDALGPSATPAEIVTGASALRAGVSAATLRRLRATRPAGPVTTHLAMLVDLIGRGVPAESASVATLVLAGSTIGDADLMAVRRLVERDIALGTPPAAATSVRVSAAIQDALRATTNVPGVSRAPKRP
jgi:hypothetical protein